MKIELVRNNKDKNHLTFVLSDSTAAFANMLRKSINEDVPTLAIEYVRFNKNNSVLYDEMLAHRLGLVPLKTDLESYQFKGENELSALNSVKLTISAKGPCTVYAKDIKSQDPKITPVFPQTPLVTLLKGQELDVEATAILGTGKEHVKWSPGIAWYSYQSTIASGSKAPAGTIVGSKVVSDDNVPYSYEVDAEATYSNENFVFSVESFGQLSSKEILERAVLLNQEKVDQFAKLI